MGAGPAGVLLERTTGERTAARDHGGELRCGGRVRGKAPREQPDRGVHAAARSGGGGDQAERNLRVRRTRWDRPSILVACRYRRETGDKTRSPVLPRAGRCDVG